MPTQHAGCQTAVVYHVDSEQLITMIADDKEIQHLMKIPSLLLDSQSPSTCKGLCNVRKGCTSDYYHPSTI